MHVIFLSIGIFGLVYVIWNKFYLKKEVFVEENSMEKEFMLTDRKKSF